MTEAEWLVCDDPIERKNSHKKHEKTQKEDKTRLKFGSSLLGIPFRGFLCFLWLYRAFLAPVNASSDRVERGLSENIVGRGGL